MSKVFCIGEALIDFVCTDGKDTFVKNVGGAPLNVAAAISKYGAKGLFVGKVGQDSFGTSIKSYCNENGIGAQHLYFDENIATTLAFVSLFENGERDFSFIRGADEQLLPKELPLQEINDGDCVHLGSATALLGGPLEESYKEALSFAKKQGVFISFDPNYRSALFEKKQTTFIKKARDILPLCDLCKFSLEEAELISGEKSPVEIVKALEQLGTKAFLITLGKNGSLFYIGRNMEKIPTIPVKSIDSTGAGDACLGFLLAQIAKDKTLLQNAGERQQSLRLANIAGALSTTKYGGAASLPTMEEILKKVTM